MEYMNPFDVLNNVENKYVDYLSATFTIENEWLEDRLKDLIRRKKVFWSDTIISIPPRYKLEKTFKEFVEETEISDEVLDIIDLKKLYTHQTKAIKKILDGKNTIVCTGTGSGKTETFLIPILDYCIKNIGKTSVKAVIIYPMNALANDQADRLRKYLYDFNHERDDKISFGVYTGATPDKIENIREIEIVGKCPKCGDSTLIQDTKNEAFKCKNCDEQITYQQLTREQMRKEPPDILITNYVQLEHLMLRKDDKDILDTGIKFIVLDEVHTYGDAQGTDVAFLIRRFIKRIVEKSGIEPICIGTSATISLKEASKKVAKFTHDLFGVKFDEENIIFGNVEPLKLKEKIIPEKIDTDDLDISLLDDNPKQLLLKLGFPDNEITDISNDSDLPIKLGRLLMDYTPFTTIYGLIYNKPRRVDEIANELNRFDLDNSGAKEVAWLLLHLASKSIDPGTELPLIMPFVHVVFRGPRGLWMCPNCKEIYDVEKVECPNCNSSVRRLGVCRYCGTHFFDVYLPDFDKILKNEKRIPSISISKQRDMERAWETSTILEDFDSPKLINAKVCERCGNHYGIDKEICLCGNKLKEYNIVKGTVCPSCGRRSQPGTQPIAYPELSSFLVARTLTDFIYEELPLDYRKMLMFVDSRQHAERFTNTLEKDTHFRFNARRAIVNIIRAGETSFDNLYRNLKGLLISEYGGESELINDRSVLQVLADEITDGTHRSLERGVGIFEVDYKGLSEEELEEIIPKIATDKFRIELKYIYEISQGNTSKFLREVLTVLADDIRLRSAVKIEINGESNQLPITPRYSCCILAVDEKVESSYFKNIFGKRTKTYQLIKQIFMKYYPEIENTDIEIKEIVLSLLRILQYLDIIKLSTERDRNANRSLSVYFINEKKLIFRIPQRVWRCNKCFRFYAYNYLENKCLVPKCNGGLKECPTLNDEAQFKQSRNLYGNTYIKDPTRMIVEVDHGGVSHARRLKIESGFKAYPPEINIIISTPTLEVGIDIGDLEVVGLIRTPPTTSNYIQRTGRAGRKRRIAFCPTFAYDDPIDNYYFRYPIKLINGEIRPPPLNPSNFVLMERHIASIIFEYLLVESNLEMPSKMGELVDEGFDRRMIEFLWKTSVKGIIAQRVKNRFESISETDARFQNSVKSIDQGIEKYKQKIEKLEADSNKITKLFTQHLGRYTRKALIKQLDRIGGKIDSLKGKDVVQYFMESLVLPRYAFPGEFVEIFEKVLYKKPTRYRHQYGIWLNPLEPRESRMAIQEYVPGKHIRSGKILYLVEGISFEEKDKEDLFLCIICGWAQIGGIECDKCPKCQSKISTKTGIKPMSAILFKAKDINRNEIAIPRSYICAGEPSEKPIPTSYGKIEKYDEIDIITTVSKLRIHHPNGQQEDNEITICEECGSVYGGREPNHHKLDMGGNCNGDPIPDVALFNEFLTQGIIINLDKKILEDIGATDPTEREKLLITFKNALISASRIVVNCEDDELNGEILNDAFSLLLFDNVAGGAGYTREIYNELDDVIKRAMDIVYSCDCDIGCPECIYSSRRRYDAERIDKRVLKKLFDHWNQKEEDITLENEFMVNAIVIHSPSGDEKVPKLVRKFIEDSKNEIFGTSLYISDEPLFWSSGDEKSWATILSNKAKEDIDVDFVVRSPKSKSEESGVEKIISSGGNIKISSKVCEELEKFGISTSLGWNKVHTKLLAIDSNGKHPIGIITTANLSSDMFDNEETLIWFNERDAVKKLREIIQEILSKSNDVIS